MRDSTKTPHHDVSRDPAIWRIIAQRQSGHVRCWPKAALRSALSDVRCWGTNGSSPVPREVALTLSRSYARFERLERAASLTV